MGEISIRNMGTKSMFFIILRVAIRLLFGRKRCDRIIYQLGWRGKDRLLGDKAIRNFVFSFSRALHTTAFLTILPLEQEVSKTLKKLKGKLFVDIGANLGFYSLLLHNNFDQVIAIEPHPANMAELKQNLKSCAVNNVVCVENAVSNENRRTVRLFIGEHDANHSLISCHEKMPLERDFVLVETVTLAKLLSSLSIKTTFKFIDLVKVDVEGAEWLVLAGAEPIVDKILAWVVELHSQALQEKKQIELWFESHNYRWRWLDQNHIFAFRAPRANINR